MLKTPTETVKRRKILIIGSYPPHQTGGVSIYTKNLAEYFEGNNNIVVISPWNGEGYSTINFSDKLVVHFIPIKPHLNLNMFLRVLIKGVGADIIQTDGAINGLIGFMKPTTPIVVTIHGHLDLEMKHSGSSRNKIKEPIFRILEKASIWRANAIITVSETLQNKIIRLSSSNTHKIKHIPNGVDERIFHPTEKDTEHFSKQFHIPKGSHVIVFAKKLAELNGIRQVVEAMPLVLERYENSILLVLGDGPLRREMEQISIELGISNNIRFAGDIPNHELPTIYNNADIFCVPTGLVPSDGRVGVGENLGLSHLEAMSCGLATISTKGDLTKRTYEEALNTSILVVPEHDPWGLAQAIIRLLSDSKYRELIANNGMKFSQRYHWTKNFNQVETIYNELLH